MRIRAHSASCLLALGLLCGWATPVRAALPRPEDVKTLESQLATARRALERPNMGLEMADRELLLEKLTATELVLQRYAKLARKKPADVASTAPLFAAGAVVIADDASGVGVVDDPLLIVIGIALAVKASKAGGASTDAELQIAWSLVTMQISALADAAARVKTRRKQGCSCVCYRKGEGPSPLNRLRDLSTCKYRCNQEGYPGYQCGGPVLWN